MRCSKVPCMQHGTTIGAAAADFSMAAADMAIHQPQQAAFDSLQPVIAVQLASALQSCQLLSVPALSNAAGSTCLDCSCCCRGTRAFDSKQCGAC